MYPGLTGLHPTPSPLRQFSFLSSFVESDIVEMADSSASNTSSSSSSSSSVIKLTFALHPNRTLRLSLHANVSNAPVIASKALAYDRGDAQGVRGRFAIMNAGRIVSTTHMAVAANTALLRTYHRSGTGTTNEGTLSSSSSSSGRRNEQSTMTGRGIALETIICAAGTTHAGNALRDYAFQTNDAATTTTNDNDPQTTVSSCDSSQAHHTILALAYDCHDDYEYQTFLQSVGLSQPQMIPDEYFQRARTSEETQDLMKTYKFTKEEMSMDGSSLEQAVLSRVATKYFV